MSVREGSKRLSLCADKPSAERTRPQTLLSELERLHHHYEQQQLPVTRQEFENRSMLYHILEDMKAFLDIKKDFITAR